MEYFSIQNVHPILGLFAPPPPCVITISGGGGASKSLVHSHFHALSKRVTQTLIAMITSEVFSCFAFYGALLVIKMYIIAIITGQLRLRRKVRVWVTNSGTIRVHLLFEKWHYIYVSLIKAFANPEDALRHGGLQYQRSDPYVERSRR